MDIPKFQLRWYLPEDMTTSQEAVLRQISNRLESYGWGDKFIREWWQTPSRNLNGHCPLEALCFDKFDLVHKCLDKTVKIYQENLELIEKKRKLKEEALTELEALE